jgi:anti-sigma regulatory factor (Ser/Thr protein kinase)
MAMAGDAAAIRMRLDREPDSAGHARQAVEDCLRIDTPTETMQNAVLLTSELVTNAMAHTVSAGELVAYYSQLGKRLRIEVRDNSPVLPRMQDDSTERVGGVGLRLVNTLASDWGTTPTATGKTVWFELKW